MAVLKVRIEPFAKGNPSISEKISANFRPLLHGPTHNTRNHRMSWNSLVDTTTLWALNVRNSGSIPGRRKTLFFSPKRPDRL